MVFLEELLKVGALDLLEHFLEGHPLDEGQIHISDLLAVTQFDRCIDQAADIIGAAPDLGHAAVDVEQGVNRFHAGAHGVLGGENSVARRLGELPNEGEVHGALRHDERTVAIGAGFACHYGKPSARITGMHFFHKRSSICTIG